MDCPSPCMHEVILYCKRIRWRVNLMPALCNTQLSVASTSYRILLALKALEEIHLCLNSCNERLNT